MKNLELKTIGLMVLLSMGLYIQWMFKSLNFEYPFITATFVIANLATGLVVLLSVINYSKIKVPKRVTVVKGMEPHIGIIIPTWSESPEMVFKTIESVLNQNYPCSKMHLIITDDSANPEMNAMVNHVKHSFSKSNISYNIPPAKGSSKRMGDAKAGNLNSAYNIFAGMPHIKYIETRDADDLVADPNFLIDSIGQLEKDKKLGYVQTIKKVIASKNDPFGNQEALFYESIMLSKNASNSVFPCGSGLVWRKEAVKDIGGFPSWNLVEDFHSGSEALRRGWNGLFLPIVGALGQISPEDLPNLYKQRGTWAMDGIRYLLWANKKGLSLKQKINFIEPGIIYITSSAIYIYALSVILSLMFGIQSLDASRFDYFLYLTPYIFSMYLFIYARSYKARVPFTKVLRSLQTYFGLSLVYLKALFLVLIYGPDKKPTYVVTRKSHKHSLYLNRAIIQISIIGLIGWSIYSHIISISSIGELSFFTIIWGAVCILIFLRMVKNSWFKWNPFRSLFKASKPNLSTN